MCKLDIPGRYALFDSESLHSAQSKSEEKQSQNTLLESVS